MANENKSKDSAIKEYREGNSVFDDDVALTFM